MVEAILNQIPPPASEVELRHLSVQSAGSFTRHGEAGLASLRERPRTGRHASKALRNEPIEFFDAERTRPRLQRATKALGRRRSAICRRDSRRARSRRPHGRGDSERCAASSTTPSAARRWRNCWTLPGPVSRKKKIRWPCRSLQEALQIEPDNATALALKSKIENRRSERQIDNWYRLARQHIDNHAYPHAREACRMSCNCAPRKPAPCSYSQK